MKTVFHEVLNNATLRLVASTNLSLAEDPLKVKSGSADWRNLYAAALFEDDKSKIAERVAEAEEAMARRAKSLFTSSSSGREAVELDQSLRMLRLLKTSLITVMEDRTAP
jgi:hypothetical protein